MGRYIKKIECLNTGGGCMVDYLILESGKVIGINDECVVLYHYDGSDDEKELVEDSEAGIIYLESDFENRTDSGQSLFVYAIETHILVDDGQKKQADVVRLKDGNVLAISNEKVSLYKNAILTPNNKLDGEIDLNSILSTDQSPEFI